MFNDKAYQKIAEFTLKLMTKYGYVLDVDKIKDSSSHHFVGKSPNGKKFVGEFQLFRSRNIPASISNDLIQRFLFLMKKEEANCAIFLTNATLKSARKDVLDILGIEVWDYDVLLEKAIAYPDISTALNSALQESQPLATSVEGKSQKYLMLDGLAIKDKEIKDESAAARSWRGRSALDKKDIQAFYKDSLISDESKKSEFQRLALELRSLGAGKSAAADFEKKCEEILKIIFEGELFSWVSQKRTAEELHRYDLIARIQSKVDFWQTVQDHFNAKYVIFEFKNYSEKISQKEIYSTEKYLYVKAMRSLAIIISPLGACKNAEEACRGALREQGKVILNLTVERVIKMLEMKLSNASPTDELVTLLDEMLMTIDR